MLKKFLFLIFTILLFLPLAFGLQDYNETGGVYRTIDSGSNINIFQLGRGDFNQNKDPSTDVNIYSKAVTTPREIPKVSDLDNDGDNEIIIIDGDTIQVIENKELTTVSSYDFGSNQYISNFIVYDIDGDSESEIVFYGTSDHKIFIINYTQSQGVTEQASISTSGLSYSGNGESVLKCEDTNKCLLFYSYNIGTGAGGRMSAVGFNSTSLYSLQLNFDSATSSYTFCLPKLRAMQSADCDADGDLDYIMSYALIGGSGSNVLIACIEDLDNTSIALSQLIDSAQLDVNDFDSYTSCSANNVGRYFTSPLVMDSTSDFAGNEKIIGYSDNAGDFLIKLFKSDGTYADRYPLITDGEGDIISNLMVLNSFPDTTGIYQDFCLLGLDESTEELNLICGARRSGLNTRSYKRSISGTFNITQDYNVLNIIAHAVQHSNEMTDGIDLNELLSAYGVDKVDYDSCDVLGNCDLENIFANPKGDSAVIQVDMDKVSDTGAGEDLIALTDSGLFYIDDGLQNEGGEIDEVYFNPCPIEDSVIKINTSGIITVTVSDQNPDGLGYYDDVSARLIMYDGTSNEYVQNSSNVSSGSPISFSVDYNKTITSGTITVIGWDVANPEETDTEVYTFTVGINGIGYGDLTCTDDVVTTLEGGDEEEEEDIESLLSQDTTSGNPIIASVIEVNELVGIGGLAIWLLVMLVADIYILMSVKDLFGQNMSIKVVALIIGIIDIIWVLVGAYATIISAGFIAVLSVLAIGAISVYFIGKGTHNAGQ